LFPQIGFEDFGDGQELKNGRIAFRQLSTGIVTALRKCRKAAG
jgi:hypothetical protein